MQIENLIMKILAQIESETTEKVYEIRVGKDLRAYCTCSAWKFSKCDPKCCKHLERYMFSGADYVGTVPSNPILNDQGFTIRAVLLN